MEFRHDPNNVNRSFPILENESEIWFYRHHLVSFPRVVLNHLMILDDGHRLKPVGETEITESGYIVPAEPEHSVPDRRLKTVSKRLVKMSEGATRNFHMTEEDKLEAGKFARDINRYRFEKEFNPPNPPVNNVSFWRSSHLG
jgi:hypothetical protein